MGGRAAGLSLGVAIERARRQRQASLASLFAVLRQRRPDIEPRTIPKAILTALSHAIEDESLSRASRPVLFASFQCARFYRREQDRWRELARGAELAARGGRRSRRRGLVERIRDQLESEPAAPAREQLRLAASITNRTLSYLA